MAKTDELLKYNGISPCPADIDKYWDEAVTEMKTVDSNVELMKVWDLPTVECFDMFFYRCRRRTHPRKIRPT